MLGDFIKIHHLYYKTIRIKKYYVDFVDSTETLFTDLWEDILVYGAENSLHFLAGALRASTKISTLKATLSKFGYKTLPSN